ncbi:DegV family protein [Oribacterium sp. WCC10]|uniref:DegV family protein n=1 Tax=Oribacterium sp. WCC10 TaxID=1855343 RepID=UPI0008EAC7C3|nr:DegV family protein [Oribacterium sp. WCC10]SFG20917.1 EDD domain protein, DegV family [Oribacterium sp. WCC10]
MDYKIIGDSCCDLTPELKADPHFTIVPLTLEIGTYSVVDDENFNQVDFLKRLKESTEGAKTACPSPEAFMHAIEESDSDENYVITISEHLSGSYQSAVIGLQMFEEDHPDSTKKVYVFSTDTATAGELNLCLTIQELKAEGKTFDEVVTIINDKIHVMQILFVLESIENLRRNGRLSAMKSFLATALNIKPVMTAIHGVIQKLDQQRGLNKAIKRMVELAVERAGGPEKTQHMLITICHVNNPERAEYVKEELLKLASFRRIVISNTMGVATVYAEDGGIVLAI